MMMDVGDGEVRISSFDTAMQNGNGKRQVADEDKYGGRACSAGTVCTSGESVCPVASHIASTPKFSLCSMAGRFIT